MEISFRGLPLLEGYDFEIALDGPTVFPLRNGRGIMYDPITQTTTIYWTQSPPVSRSAVKSLPLVAIEKNSKEDSCLICLEDWLLEGDVAAEMPCKHKFHYDCVEIQPTCPVCRYKMPIVGEEEFKKFENISVNETEDDGESIDYYEYYNYTDDDCGSELDD